MTLTTTRPAGAATMTAVEPAATARRVETGGPLAAGPARGARGARGACDPRGSLVAASGRARESARESEHFARIEADGWRLHAPRGHVWPDGHSKPPPEPGVWAEAWPALWADAEAGRLEVIKQGSGGDVLSCSREVGGRSYDLIVKRPRAAHVGKALADCVRTPRARRSWRRTWRLLALGMLAERPMLLAERRRFGKLGRVVDSAFVSQRVPGEILHTADLDALGGEDRRRLLRRVGTTLRRLEDHGLSHTDAKAYNWIVNPAPAGDAARGTAPVLIDCDAVKPGRAGEGLLRLVRALRERGLGDADIMHVRAGYGA